jgi:hypothetical protein
MVSASSNPERPMDSSYPGVNSLQASSKKYTRISLSGILCCTAVLALGFALQISHGFLNWKALIAVTASILLCAMALAFPRFTLLLPFSKPAAMRRSFLLLLVAYFAAGIVFLRIRHLPIDVLIMENDSVHALLHGIDPYGRDVTHRDIYTPEQGIYGPGTEVNGRVRVGFPYPPLTLIWILPGYLLGDVRYSFLLAIVLTALMLFYCEPNLNGVVSAVLLLFVPDTLFVLTFGWTEPLMVMTLGATVLAARRAPRWLPVALGLFFASKQYSLLAVPLAAMLLPAFSWKAYSFLLAKAGAVAGVVTAPFLLWDPRGFWWSLVGFRLVLPLRTDALSFSALLATHGFRPIPQWIVVSAVVAGTGFALKKAPRTPAGFAASLGMVSLIFFVMNIAGFCNYYFFCAGALCLGLSGAAYDSGEALFAIVKLSQSTVAHESMALSGSRT